VSIIKIRVANFKSFKDTEVKLGNFNVLIGANASGKSNFVSIFKFLRDIANSGLDNAISMQGGVEYLRNLNISTSENLSILALINREFRWIGGKSEEKIIGIKTTGTKYFFQLKFNKKGRGFRVEKDVLIHECKYVRLKKNGKNVNEEETGEGQIIISSINREVNIEISPENAPLKKEDLFPLFLKEEKLPAHTLLIETSNYFVVPLKEMFSNLSIYDFDPKLPKRATPITGKAELEEDGSNLSIILKNIMENKEKKRKLFNLVKDLLPFINNLDVEKFADKSLLFKLQEKFFENQYLPASLISDGTINIAALIIALYFEKKPIIIIEEPERNIHPYLISKVVEMMKDASQEKQIIVTTHNPEIVKYAGLENIMLVSRDKNGFSSILRPTDKEEVKTFLKNDIGIEELYVQNLLEI